MAARNRLPPWHESIRLPNGREVLIRPIRPEDAGPLKASFALLEPDEIRNRFLQTVKELSDEDVQRLTHPDPRSEFALVVAEPYPAGEAPVSYTHLDVYKRQARALVRFYRRAASVPAKSALRIELQVRPDDSPLRMNGSGLVIWNAPWQFDRSMTPALKALARALGEAVGGEARLDWLRPPA